MENRLNIRRASFDIHYGTGAADKLMQAPWSGRTAQSVANELGVTKQYVSAMYVRLTGRTWSSVLNEMGINTRGPRVSDHHPETV